MRLTCLSANMLFCWWWTWKWSVETCSYQAIYTYNFSIWIHSRQRAFFNSDIVLSAHCTCWWRQQRSDTNTKEVQIVYRLFLVNCYLLHVPRLPSQPASNVGGWVIDIIWFEVPWEYIAMTRNNLSIIWISLTITIDSIQDSIFSYGFKP